MPIPNQHLLDQQQNESVVVPLKLDVQMWRAVSMEFGEENNLL